MPTSVIVGMAGYGAGVAAGTLALSAEAFLTYMAYSVGAQLLLQGVGKAIADTSSTNISNAQNLTTNLRSPIAPRRILYGQRRVGGVLVYAQARDSSGTDKQLNLIIALAGHEVGEIGDIWLDDKVVALDGSGNASAAPYKIPADPTQRTQNGTVPASPYQVTLTYTPMEIESVSVSADGGETYSAATYTRSGSTLTFAAGHAGALYQVVYLEAGASTSHARIKKYLGTSTQTADADLIAVADGKWTSNHRLRGIAYVYAALISNREVFPSGIPNITAVVKGKKVYDPRTGLTAWSRNPALILADYLCDAKYGLGCTYADEIDEIALIAAANICDETVSLAAGGTEPRYCCDIAFDASTAPADVIQQILTSMAGTCVYLGGKWRIQAGAYVAPTVTLTEADLRGPIRIQSRVSRRDQFNAVRGTFVSVDDNWQPTDFPAVVSSTFATEDNGETVYKDIELTATLSPTAAQRLAKIDLLRARQQITVTLSCKLSAYQVQPGDTVALTLARYGWTSKVFEVQGSRFAVDQDGSLGIDLVLRETSASVWSWSTSEEQAFDPSPDTDLPDPFSTAAPTGVTLTAASLSLQGVSTSDLLLSWTASVTPYVNGYEVQWRLIQASDWTSVSVDPGVYKARLAGAMSGGTYVARVRATSVVGVTSAWAYSSAYAASAVGTPTPGAGTNLLRNAGLRYSLFPWERYNGSASEASSWTFSHLDGISGTGAPHPYGAIKFESPALASTFTGFAAGCPATYMASTDTNERIAVQAGTRYEVQLRVSTVNGRSQLKVLWYDGSGTLLSSSLPTGGVAVSTNSATPVVASLAGYELLWGFVTAPATATRALLVANHERISGTVPSVLITALPLMAEAGPYQLLPSPWCEGEGAATTATLADNAATAVATASDFSTGGVSSNSGAPNFVTLLSVSATNSDSATRDVLVAATFSHESTRLSSYTLQLEYFLYDGTNRYQLADIREATESTIYGTTTIQQVFSLGAGATKTYSLQCRQSYYSGSTTWRNMTIRAEVVKK